MPADYQLPASIALAATAVISAAVNLVTPKQEGKLRLEGPEGEQEHDPFNVTTPEDVAPGEPIDGPQFWSRVCGPNHSGSRFDTPSSSQQVRFLKFILLLNFVFILILQTISFGWSITILQQKDAIIPILNAFTPLYLIFVTALTLNHDIPDVHFTQVVHIASITTTATLIFTSIAILPSSEVSLSGQAEDAVVWGLHYAIVALYTVACLIAVNIPRGPALHFPPEQIYSEKTVASTTSRYRDNVCGIVNDSILGILLFSYTTKVPPLLTVSNQFRSSSRLRLLCWVTPLKVLKSATCPSCPSICVRPTCFKG